MEENIQTCSADLVSVQQLYLIVLGQHPQSLSLCAFSLLQWWVVEETQKDKVAVDTVTKTAVCVLYCDASNTLL